MYTNYTELTMSTVYKLYINCIYIYTKNLYTIHIYIYNLYRVDKCQLYIKTIMDHSLKKA